MSTEDPRTASAPDGARARRRGPPPWRGKKPGEGIPKDQGVPKDDGKLPDEGVPPEEGTIPGTEGQLHKGSPGQVDRGAPGQMDPWAENPWATGDDDGDWSPPGDLPPGWDLDDDDEHDAFQHHPNFMGAEAPAPGDADGGDDTP